VRARVSQIKKLCMNTGVTGINRKTEACWVIIDEFTCVQVCVEDVSASDKHKRMFEGCGG